MATKGVFKVKCGACGEQFDADFWTVVRGDKDLELKEMLISGEFDLLMCPHCSEMVSYEETFIYLDPGKELFVFVMPEAYRAEKAKWLEKMRSDYDTVKASLRNVGSLNFEPACFFGAAELSALLLRDRDIEEETEVMEFIAAEKKFSVVPVNPSFARAHDLPFSLPYSGASPSRAAALAAARDIAASNDALLRVGNLLRALEALKGADIDFIRRTAHAT
ncbi:MAG: hypothetical protein A3J79_05115 [Elusimicrobia bacterium RIFOXYB2_FULL_62_6]|nr:MAG: hypothetical protein A3J79_05115 [Elusimicrobia bacterium RIFOXYB2_FULL_62_6]